MEGFAAETALSEKIPVERLKMSEVEDDPMPFRDWALVKRVRPYKVKKLIRAGAGLREAFKEFMPNSDSVLRGKHFPGLLSG
jgi:hypothetical protein